MSVNEEFVITRDSMLGVPITGEYNEGLDWGVQLSPAEFAALLQPVMDDPEIVRFGWEQYTPFFNDGDTCEFSSHQPWFVTRADEVRLNGNLGDIDTYDYEVGSSYSPHPSLGQVEPDHTYHGTTREWIVNPKAGQYTGYSRATFDRCVALSDAISGSSCYRVLLDAFGDHAEITFTRDPDTSEWAAHREHYSHD